MTTLEQRLTALRDMATELAEWANGALKTKAPKGVDEAVNVARQVGSLALAVQRAAQGREEPK